MGLGALLPALVPPSGMMAPLEGVVELVRAGRPRATIVSPPDGPPSYAAEVLQRYIERMSGARLPIVTDPSKAEGTKVVIRTREGAAKFDGFRIVAAKGIVLIEASIPRGCIYGAYALLERLGCRFYGTEPLGVIVPKRADLSLPEGLDILCEPDFENRLPSFGGPEEHIRWGYNFTFYTRDPKRRRLIERLGLKKYRWGHIWPELIKYRWRPDGKREKMDYSDKRDWLPADEKGIRRYNGQTLCFSNPEAFWWFVENAVNWVLCHYADADYISMWPADTWRIALCRCERCKARGWNDTDWYIYIHNEIWRQLKKRGWKGVFGWIAYHGSEEPPKSVGLLEEGREMDFLYAPRPRGASMHGPFTNDHPVNVKYRENLRRWRAYLSPFKGSRTVFEYYYDLVLLGFLAPGRVFLIPKHEDLKEEIRFYLGQGFNGFFNCNPPSGALFPDPLSRWLYRKLLWDVDLDIEAARRDFFEHYYGPAAGVAREVREEIERLMFEPPSAEVVGRLKALKPKIEEALKRATDDLLRRRLKGMSIWVEYCALAKESELHEKVTKDAKKGKAVELSIRRLFQENKKFLVENGLMREWDVNYVAGPVVDRHLALFDRMLKNREGLKAPKRRPRSPASARSEM